MAVAPTAAQHAASMQTYFREGEQRAQQIGNRGPVKLASDGKLHPDIREAFLEHGFYIFEGLVNEDEIALLRTEIERLIDRAPVGKNASLDAKGRPAYGQKFAQPIYSFVKPLSDPWGGTELLSGRHPVQMTQPAPDASAPDEVVQLIGGMCQTTDPGLRLYGHPMLLTIAEAINGDDFVPFNDATFVKLPGLGGSVAWHQDGVTHWDSPDWDPGIHGFNFQVQLYPATSANCLWVVPGSHKEGRVDIKGLIAENDGSELLPTAIPLTCNAGDVTIANRQILHCSFANTSPNIRVAMTFGFHRRRSVVGAKGALTQKKSDVYDEKRVFERSRVIAVAIDARAQHYPNEPRYIYQPFVGLEDEFRWSPETYERVIKDYNLQDLSI